MDKEKGLTPGQVAALYGVSTDTVYSWINDPDERRQLVAEDVSGGDGDSPRWRITKEMLDDFQARRRANRPRRRARGAKISTQVTASQ